MIEMDESEHTADQPTKWWELLDNTKGFVKFHYNDIMQHGSDELKNAVNIVLGGQPPSKYKKGESA
ncbi:hypothetical protein LOZ80_25905 [Paenibacillus sp. HWE-109]|uniref:hypothetical protein n=1 Tax=Paenibacillus sp. HWE-109 TaxID=1306526 RepID=UPI001EDD6CD4|nr:hypothetical protein [Paenibacillus sp. HWE-109]UKS25015.1 hypothetical protein LOZ80_25905 [Paenibacillus sp. HWE-109]